MAPIPEKAKEALKAMKALEIPSKVAAPVLKKLLKLYDNNWEYIEAENYRVLVDAIFEMQEAKEAGDDVVQSEELNLHRTRTRSRQEETQQSPSLLNSGAHDEAPPKRTKLEGDVSPGSQLQKKRGELASSSSDRERATVVRSPEPPEKSGQVSSSRVHTEKQTSTASLQVRNRKDKQLTDGSSKSPFIMKEPKAEPETETPLMYEAGNCSSAQVLPDGNSSPTYETPLAICPPCSAPSEIIADHRSGNQNDILSASNLQPNVNRMRASTGKYTTNAEESPPSGASNKATTSALVTVSDASTINIASSESGDVKLSFICSSEQPNFEVPDLEAVFRRVEERCLHSYRILQPTFSLRNVMQELCQSFLELGSKPVKDNNAVKIVPTLDSLKKHGVCDLFGGITAYPRGSLCSVAPDGPGPITTNGTSSHKVRGSIENGRNKKTKHLDIPEPSNALPNSLAVVQPPQVALDEPKPLHDVNDISKGEEKVRISVINEIGSEKYPPYFNYIPRNIVYQNAYVNFSLARIGDEDCCADCFDDCLAAPIPCACARETGGEFAYTSDCLIKKEFLDECISMNHKPEKHRLFYCKDCPLERSKNEAKPESCKGHLIRKFVKECWSKCGCSMQCGNRVVQRGIRCNLQVFLTRGKGWGVRTLDELPRGYFVCEYVGEVLTNTELYYRTIQTTGNARHTYPVLLDADWGSESNLKDEEALCLDATFYGNVARFVNHRCCDANLVEVPVEVETPDHHYYHLAFFTSRKVEAYEELTWDYGIDFEDHEHPIKAFKCRCGSKYCRDRRASSRSRAKALVLG